MYVKVSALVLREEPKSETGRFLTLLTENGILRVTAKGANKLTGSRTGETSLFAYSEMMLYSKNGFYTLSEASLKEGFFKLSKTVYGFALASYMAELLIYCVTEGEDSEEILKLTLNALYATANEIASPRLIKAAFELKLCALLGYAPETDICPVCDEQPSGELLLDITDGCLLCKECAEQTEPDTKLMPICADTVKAIKFINESKVNKLFLFRLNGEAAEELFTAAEDFLTFRLEKKCRSLEILKQLL